MERRSVESLVRALNEAGVRYLIVGGLAVVAHGHARFTGDVDLVVDLEADNARRAVAALESLRYRPRAPVRFAEFADAAKRADWVRTKGMTVFSASSPDHAATEVDLFVENPFDFADAHARASRFEVAPGVEAPFVSVPDLIAMKRKAGRPVDLEDIRVLDELQRERGEA